MAYSIPPVLAPRPPSDLPPPSTFRARGGAYIADRLAAEGRISASQRARVVDYASSRRARVEDALIELTILREIDLLKYLATLHGTRFVSTDKLAQASIPSRVLRVVPVRVADFCAAFPVMLDDQGNLTVITADPGDEIALQEIRVASVGVRRVHALAARPAAVRAAIAYHYRDDRFAFRALACASVLLDFLAEEGGARAAGATGAVRTARTAR